MGQRSIHAVSDKGVVSSREPCRGPAPPSGSLEAHAFMPPAPSPPGLHTATPLKWQGAQAALFILGHDFPFPKIKRTPWFFCPASVCCSRLFLSGSLLGALWFPWQLVCVGPPPTKFRHAGTIAGGFQFTFQDRAQPPCELADENMPERGSGHSLTDLPYI